MQSLLPKVFFHNPEVHIFASSIAFIVYNKIPEKEGNWVRNGKKRYRQTPAEGLSPMFLYLSGFFIGCKTLSTNSSRVFFSAPTSFHDTFGIVAKLKKQLRNCY